MKNVYVKSVLVLSVICLIAASAMGAVNYITAPVIAEAAKANETASLKNVLPDATDFENVTPGTTPETVTGVYRDKGGSGYAVTLSCTSSYSKSPMTFTAGFSNDGKITAVEVTDYTETKSFGDYPERFVGKDSALGGVDVYSGATYSSNAFKGAVSDAFSVLLDMGAVAEGEKSEEQIIDELKIKALPGAVNGAGKLMVKEMKASDAGLSAAYEAENGVGWLFVLETDEGKAVAAISAAGGAVCYNLEGNDITDKTELEALRALCDNTAAAKKNLAAAEKAAEGSALEELSLNTFGTVAAAYKAENGRYVFVCTPFGYSEPMRLTYVLNGEGEIVSFRVSGEMIQQSEYYKDYTLDEKAYAEGLGGKNAGELGDAAAISGATVTATAVKTAAADAFAALKEAVK